MSMKNEATRTRWAGFSLGNAPAASLPMVNSPPGIATMPGGFSKVPARATETAIPIKNRQASRGTATMSSGLDTLSTPGMP